MGWGTIASHFKKVPMERRITYPLRFAISLSPSAGAIYSGMEGHITIHTLEGWFAIGNVSQKPVCEEFDGYEDCSWYLAAHRIPENTGWQPEPLALLPDEGWLK